MAIDLENREQFQNSQELLKQFSNMSPNASDEQVKEKYTEYMNAYSERFSKCYSS
ncbi:hypothetical protein ACVDHH_04850 [Staphylococcus saprophyticus]